MATPESRVKTKLDRMLKSFGPDVWFFSPQAGPYGRSGVPDRIACVNGHFMAIECKANADCKPTALQEKAINEIRNAHGAAYVVYDDHTIGVVRAVIKELI